MNKNIRDHFDSSLNFWAEYPEFSTMPGFKEIYKADKLRSKRKSSEIAWAIHFAYNHNSKFYNIPEKLFLIARDVLKDEEFKWSNKAVVAACEIYKQTVLTQAERSLESWNQTLMMRDKGLKEWYKDEFDKDISERNIKIISELDKQMSSTAKFFADFKNITAALREEGESKKVKIKGESDSDDF